MVANAVPTSDPVEIARNRAAQHKYICWRAEKVGHAALISVFCLIFLPLNDLLWVSREGHKKVVCAKLVTT
jgi:hypothetical protein